jgi:hypothetical protein
VPPPIEPLGARIGIAATAVRLSLRVTAASSNDAARDASSLEIIGLVTSIEA